MRFSRGPSTQRQEIRHRPQEIIAALCENRYKAAGWIHGGDLLAPAGTARLCDRLPAANAEDLLCGQFDPRKHGHGTERRQEETGPVLERQGLQIDCFFNAEVSDRRASQLRHDRGRAQQRGQVSSERPYVRPRTALNLQLQFGILVSFDTDPVDFDSAGFQLEGLSFAPML